MKLIIAPHPDDEVIGCSRLLTPETRVLFTTSKAWTEERKKEATLLAKALSFRVIVPCTLARSRSGSLEEMWREHGSDLCVFAPDPVWETHPDHVDIGCQIRTLSREMDFRFFTYTTNMRAPYVEELSKGEALMKKDMLAFYESQSDLWKYDHRYFLFEGIAEWNPTVA